MAKRKKRDSLKDFVIHHLAQGSADASKGLLKYLRPIYKADSAGEPELIGSGVLIAAGEHHFFVTAAHVLDQEARPTFYIPTESTGELAVLEGDSVHSTSSRPDRADDLIDIAVVHLRLNLVEALGSEIFLSPADIDLDDVGDPTRVYIAMGYPWRKNLTKNRDTKRMRSSVSSYAANVLPPETLEAAGLTRKSHLLLKYRKRHSRNLAGRDVTAPDPHGMSGGALWKFDPYGLPAKVTQLVGILIEWKRPEGGLLVVRMPVIFAAITRLCPQIEADLPVPSSVNIIASEAVAGHGGARGDPELCGGAGGEARAEGCVHHDE